VARVHAEIWARLARRGRTIGAHDLWIAATALSNGFGLATLERDFRRVRGLRLIAPGT
jgi:tRNA(fMet)-specific endonuclease VapC